MSDPFADFSCLDELTQVIYQGIHKFVVISTVAGDKWNIHVGLSGRQGRWWKGCWTEKDVHRLFSSKTSDKQLEFIAEKIADTFIQGELCISDWSADKGAKIKLTCGPTAKKPLPVHVNLVEMSPEEGAAYATSVFIDIALQAQSRKCRLYPSSTDSSDYVYLPNALPSSSQPSTSTNLSVPSKRKEPSPDLVQVTAQKRSSITGVDTSKTTTVKNTDLEDEIKSLRAMLAKKEAVPVSEAKASSLPPGMRPRKGASLANPNKKARKTQAIEFGSDEDE